jgi:hypothetical protein
MIKRRHRRLSKALMWVGAIALLLCLVFNNTTLGKIANRDLGDLTYVSNTILLFRIVCLVSGLFLLANRLYLELLIRRKKELTLLLVVSILCIMLIEVSIPLIDKMSSRKERTYTNLEFEITSKLNSDLFRDYEFVKKKDPETMRILMLGDSFVYGVAVNKTQTFEYLLERGLDRQVCRGDDCVFKDVEIYNLGLSGIGLREYVDNYRKFEGYQHDAVILVIYVDNDINNYDAEKEKYIKMFEFFDSMMLKNIRGKIAKLGSDEGPDCDRYKAELGIDDKYYGACKRSLINIWLFEKFLAFARTDYNDYYDLIATQFADKTGSKSNILRISEMAESNGVPLFVFIMPGRYQVSDYGFEELGKIGFHASDKIVQNRKIQEEILSFCKDEGITCFDLLPGMKEAEQPMYPLIDDHLNVYGNRKVAELMFYYLTADKEFKNLVS